MFDFYNIVQSIEISDNQSGVLDNISLSKITGLRINDNEVSIRSKPINNDAQDELCNSILKNGLLNPIIVRSFGDGMFQLISGRRRVEAFKRLGLRKILSHIIDVDDKKAYEISLIECLHTERISPLEEGVAFKKYVQEFGWGGISDLASRIDKSVTYIDRRIKLLELPEELQNDVNMGELKPSLASELLAIKNPQEQSRLALLIKERSPSLREFRRMVKQSTIESGAQNVFVGEGESGQKSRMLDIQDKTERSFDQTIIAIRMCMNKISSVIANNEDNWIVYETLMHHKRVLHEQIDILYREKKKLTI